MQIRPISALLTLLTVLTLAVPAPVHAERQENDVAVFATLDKVTGRIQTLEIHVGETQAFGALKITPRVCYSRPPTEPPLTSAFIDVDAAEIDGKLKRIFTGWMFAESPGLHAVEHPVFDAWLTSCKMPRESKSRGRAPKSPRP
jgi:hypothetical protein